MRWVCPRCRSVVSVAFSECPHCAPEAPPAEAPSGPPLSRSEPPPALAAPPQPDASALSSAPDVAGVVAAPPPVERTEARATATARTIRQAFQRPEVGLEGWADEEEMTPFRRGLEMGVGFMLAVVIILFLLSLLFFWLSAEPGWQPWWERLLG